MIYDQFYSFTIKAKRTVYKWWCVIYMPVYKLTHNGYWPEEKNPYAVFPDPTPADPAGEDVARQMAENLMHEKDENLEFLIQDTISDSDTPKNIETPPKTAAPVSAEQSAADESAFKDEVDLSKYDSDTVDRANEIMARLAREAAEDEAKKQAEIEAARRVAREQEQLASIMNANKVDINQYIEEGKAHQKPNIRIDDN